MATIKKKIEFTEKDLKEVLCNLYNLDKNKSDISIYVNNSDERYSTVTIEGVEKEKPITWTNR
jgi:hypothetical protein